MKLCIICREKKADTKNNRNFNKEHVFPESIGGRYIIKSVCTICNKKLGDMIDKPLLEHDFISFFRNEYKLSKGKRKVPAPYKNFNKRNPDFTIIKANDQYRTRLKHSNSITVDKENKRITITTDDLGRSKFDIEKEKEKYTKEFGVLRERILVTEKKEEGGYRRIEVDAPNRPLILSTAKIGYELACEKVDGYLDDELGKCYAKMFSEGKCNDTFIERNILDVESMEIKISKENVKYLSKNHLAILHFHPRIGLIATVILFDPIPPLYQSLVISRNYSKYEDLKPIVLVNDFKLKHSFFI